MTNFQQLLELTRLPSEYTPSPKILPVQICGGNEQKLFWKWMAFKKMKIKYRTKNVPPFKGGNTFIYLFILSELFLFWVFWGDNWTVQIFLCAMLLRNFTVVRSGVWFLSQKNATLVDRNIFSWRTHKQAFLRKMGYTKLNTTHTSVRLRSVKFRLSRI